MVIISCLFLLFMCVYECLLTHVHLCVQLAFEIFFLTWGSLTETLYPDSSCTTVLSKLGFPPKLLFLRASLLPSYCILMSYLQSHRPIKHVRGRSTIKYLKTRLSRGFIKPEPSFVCQTSSFSSSHQIHCTVFCRRFLHFLYSKRLI